MDELVGQSLGQYQITRRLGQGGMATVYLATQTSMGREVAVKVLPSHFANDDSFMQRFYREVEVIASLQHPHIVPVYDFGEHDGRPFLVMAYLAGGTLGDLIEQGPMDFEDIRRMVTQIASALDYAHSKDIIHRDFKPSNVLLDEQHNVYLSDFGLAKVREASVQLTGSGIIGTPSYMAPEQANAGEPTRSIDVYALGVTVFQMLTGQLPYEAPTAFGVLMAHVTKPIPNLLAVRPDLPAAAQTVIELSMAKASEMRYPSTGELATALVGILQSDGSEAPYIITGPREVTGGREALLFTNMVGQVIFVDHQFLKMTKRSAGDVRNVVGKPLHEIVGLDRETVDQLMQDLARAGHVDARPLRLQDTSGATLSVYCSGVATYDSDGSFVGADLTLRQASETPDYETISLQEVLATQEESVLKMYFSSQIQTLYNLLAQTGGKRLAGQLEKIVNETAQRNVWPVSMRLGQVKVDLKVTQADVYKALLSKATAFASGVLGPGLVKRKMQAVDKSMDAKALQLISEAGLNHILPD